jgi:hypothetical protein
MLDVGQGGHKDTYESVLKKRARKRAAPTFVQTEITHEGVISRFS